MEEVLSLIGVYKVYGSRTILHDINLQIYSGEVFCLVGPNGAGKTTTLRIMATLVKPSRGHLRFFGKHIRGDGDILDVRRKITYLPEESDTYFRLTGYEYLEFFAKLYDQDNYSEIVELGVEISGLSREDLSKKTGTYSKGMRRRLLLARSLMVRPKIAILDEPTSGLDVFSNVAIRSRIREFTDRYGTTIILSSHNMLEVMSICDRVSLIDRGRIIYTGTPDEAIERTGARDLEEAFIKLVNRSGDDEH